MSTLATPAPEAQAPINHLGRMIGAIVSPKKTFGEIAQRPSWLVPMALMVVLGIGVGALLNTRMNWGSYIRQKAEENPRFAQLPEDQKANALAMQVKLWSYLSYAVGPLVTVISALCFALIYWGAFNLFSGAGLKFGQSFGISTHALLPTVIGSVLALIIIPLKAYGEIDPEHLLATNVAALLGDNSPKWLVSLGSSLDVLWIWVLVLFAIGFSAANPKKVKPGTAFGIVFGLWAVWVLGKVGWAMF